MRLEAGLRIDHSGLARESIASPRLGRRVDLTPRTRLRGAIGHYTQSPGYEKLLQSDYFVDLTSADSGQITSERSLHVIGAIERALTSSVARSAPRAQAAALLTPERESVSRETMESI